MIVNEKERPKVPELEKESLDPSTLIPHPHPPSQPTQDGEEQPASQTPPGEEGKE